ISFNTRHPDVRVSERLRNKYEKEMTIVLQHQFWNLQVSDRDFEVELSFNEIAEKLVVPFSAVKGFFDPAAQFALQFEMVEEKAEAVAEPAPSPTNQPAHGHVREAPAEALPAPAPAGGPRPSNDDQKIVSLDSFRKK
ncbi:MAG: ClpXP protease specificity-enhancing factor SspB, partial [Aestuariivirgaceae bacterium]